MAAVVIRGTARARWLTGLADLRARTGEMARRAMACVAAGVMVCAIGAALLQLVVEILSLPAPMAATGITVMTAVLLGSLRRRLRSERVRRPRSFLRVVSVCGVAPLS
jgi:biotin transporter BioY